MKRWSTSRLVDLLSQYVDGELNESQTKEVEECLATDEQAAQILAEVKAVKGLVQESKTLPPDHWFWTRLSAEIEKREREEENLLPFPRKYVPAVMALGAIMLGAIGIFFFQNRTPLIDYVSRQSQRMQEVYEQGVLKGNLFPVFDKVDKNQVLQFALFGTLPLDTNVQSSLTIDESAERGYRIDVGRTPAKPIPTVTVRELVKEVNPSAAQMQVIDSLLDFGRQQIESSVFMSEHKAVVMDPSLPGLNRVILSSIAACLEPLQRVRFERFLQARNAPYMLASFEGKPAKPENIYSAVNRPGRSERFLVLTPDTLVLAQVELDLDSLREAALKMFQNRRETQIEINAVLQTMFERGRTGRWKYTLQSKPFQIHADFDMISIQLPERIDIGRPGFKEVVIRPRIPQGSFESVPRSRSSLNFRYSRRDSGMRFEMQIDSLMMRFFRDVPRGMLNFEEVDSMLDPTEFRLNPQPEEEMHAHIREAFRKHQVDFDSLRQQIRKWMMAPPAWEKRAKRE